MTKRKRPERNLSEVKDIRHQDSDTKVNEKGAAVSVDKHATTMTVVNAEEAKGADASGFLSPELFVPTAEQLEKINQFTLRPVQASEVACFTTHSCNDLIDRDDDRFNPKAVKGFAELPHPYSPTGKSFMVGHDYTQLAVGRIFDTDTGTFKVPGDNATHHKLTNDVYIPRLASTEDFIAKQEMGVNWAVSVGVMLGQSKCYIGGVHEWGWAPWFCSKGHEKGLSYDPDSDKEDDWGWPEPVSESSAKGVKCFRDLDEAKDMYELSQVFLGAQYQAQIDKDPTFSGIIKAANKKSVHILGLSQVEAKELRMPHLPDKAVKASRDHRIKEEDGTFRWVDEQKLVWTFTPGEDTDPLLLGKQSEGVVELAELKAKRLQIEEKFTKVIKDAENPEFKATTKTTHGAFTGSHSHEHATYDAQGDDDEHTHDHEHDGDAIHDHHDPNTGEDGGGNDTQQTAQALATLRSYAKSVVCKDSDGDDAVDIAAQVSKLRGLIVQLDAAITSQDLDRAGELIDTVNAAMDELYNAMYDDEDDSDQGGEDADGDTIPLDRSATNPTTKGAKTGDEVSKKTIALSLARVELPKGVIDALEKATDETALDVVFKALQGEFKTLEEKAASGDAYVKSLRTDVLANYRKAHQDPKNSGVDVSHIEKLLNAVGDDPEALKIMRDDYEAQAAARLGVAVRRSSVETDHNAPTGDSVTGKQKEIEDRSSTQSDSDRRVSRIHG